MYQSRLRLWSDILSQVEHNESNESSERERAVTFFRFRLLPACFNANAKSILQSFASGLWGANSHIAKFVASSFHDHDFDNVHPTPDKNAVYIQASIRKMSTTPSSEESGAGAARSLILELVNICSELGLIEVPSSGKPKATNVTPFQSPKRQTMSAGLSRLLIMTEVMGARYDVPRSIETTTETTRTEKATSDEPMPSPSNADAAGEATGIPETPKDSYRVDESSLIRLLEAVLLAFGASFSPGTPPACVAAVEEAIRSAKTIDEHRRVAFALQVLSYWLNGRAPESFILSPLRGQGVDLEALSSAATPPEAPPAISQSPEGSPPPRIVILQAALRQVALSKIGPFLNDFRSGSLYVKGGEMLFDKELLGKTLGSWRKQKMATLVLSLEADGVQLKDVVQILIDSGVVKLCVDIEQGYLNIEPTGGAIRVSEWAKTESGMYINRSTTAQVLKWLPPVLFTVRRFN